METNNDGAHNTAPEKCNGYGTRQKIIVSKPAHFKDSGG